MKFLDLIHSKLELFRLEQRYTRRRNRRSTFVSEAVYVDGEYIYSPTSSYSAKCSAGGNSDSEEDVSRREVTSPEPSKEAKTNKRRSMMALGDWRKGTDESRQNKRQSRISVREIKWDTRA